MKVDIEDAAIAFGCNPQTMRQFYLALDEVEITDEVMDTIQGGNGEKNGETHDAPSPHTDDPSSGEPNREHQDGSPGSGV